MTGHKDSKEVLDYWQQQAILARRESHDLRILDEVKNIFVDDQGGGTLKDKILRKLEIQTIVKYLPDGASVIDLGCGNGYSTYEFAARRNVTVVGVDYSNEMIFNANRSLEEHSNNEIVNRLQFKQADVMNLSTIEKDTFDVAITERCLINLTSWEDQQKAIDQVRDVLKVGGLFIMLEGFIQGLYNLNQQRRKFGLEDIKVV